jgi:hypothetical protein
MTRRRRIVIGVGLAALVIVAIWQVPSAYHGWSVQRLIARFTAAPDQETADKLCELLDNQRVSQEVGNRILEMLTKPKVEVRDPYPAGEKQLCLEYSLPCSIAFRHLSLGLTVFDNSRPDPSKQGRSAMFSGDRMGDHPWDTGISLIPQTDGHGILDDPGDHVVTLSFMADLTERRHRPVSEHVREFWPWVRSGFGTQWPLRYAVFTRHYACKSDVTFKVRAAALEDCEQVQLRSDPALDERMKASFVAKAYPWDPAESVLRGKPFRLWCTSPPLDCAFRGVYRPEQGGTQQDLGPLFFNRRGSSGIWLDQFWGSLPRGKYKGTLALTPDPVLALRMAGVKEIWGGTLEFPVEFEIAEKAGATSADDAKEATP